MNQIGAYKHLDPSLIYQYPAVKSQECLAERHRTQLPVYRPYFHIKPSQETHRQRSNKAIVFMI